MNQPQTVPDLFRQTKADWVNGARTVAIRLLRKRHTITIEDVLAEYKFPKYLHRNTIGSVFQDGHFIPVGYVPSRRRVSHGRTIRQWTLNDKYIVEKEGYCE